MPSTDQTVTFLGNWNRDKDAEYDKIFESTSIGSGVFRISEEGAARRRGGGVQGRGLGRGLCPLPRKKFIFNNNFGGILTRFLDHL